MEQEKMANIKPVNSQPVADKVSFDESGARFAFGKNWKDFLDRYLSKQRVEEAKKSLLGFCGQEAIKGKTFLDIGCGSGLFSLAVYELGAAKVVSFDYDEDSVAATGFLRQRAGEPKNWTVGQGSILDEKFVSSLGKFDLVYSWGVLHHTGRMWEAIDRAGSLVADGGLLWIAIYNKTDCFGFFSDGRLGTSGLWKSFKRLYVSLPRFLQRAIDLSAMFSMIVIYLISFQNPISKIKRYDQLRGMSWSIDIRDWLGGYPYEYASVEEIFHFASSRGFSLLDLKMPGGLRNNEFLFLKNKKIN